MKVSIIIVNYNTSELLRNCLISINQHKPKVKFEVIVVDNGSTDDSRDIVRKEFPHVILIESSENLGFGRANNLGSKYAKGEFLFLLNSDTILIEDSISKLCNTLDSDKSIACVGCKLVNMNGEAIHSFNRFPTLASSLRNAISPLKWTIFGKKTLFRSLDEFSDTPFKVDYITGADLLIRRKIWDEIDGFDKKIFLYYEETDLQKRIHNLGYTRIIDPSVSIIHLEGQSSKPNLSKTIMYTSGELYYLRKHYHSLSYLLYKILFILAKLISPCNLTWSEKIKYISSIVKFNTKPTSL